MAIIKYFNVNTWETKKIKNEVKNEMAYLCRDTQQIRQEETLLKMRKLIEQNVNSTFKLFSSFSFINKPYSLVLGDSNVGLVLKPILSEEEAVQLKDEIEAEQSFVQNDFNILFNNIRNRLIKQRQLRSRKIIWVNAQPKALKVKSSKKLKLKQKASGWTKVAQGPKLNKIEQVYEFKGDRSHITNSPFPYKHSGPQIKIQGPRVFYRDTSKDKKSLKYDTETRLSQERIFNLKARFNLRMLYLFDKPELANRLADIDMDIPKPQMDSEPTSISVEKKGNVVMVTDSHESKEETVLPLPSNFANFATSSQPSTYNSLVGRYTRIATCKWKVGNDVGELIAAIDPLTILSNMKGSQAAALLSMHKLFRFNLKFKIVINASPWQVGLLVADWSYGAYQHSVAVQNVYSALQRNHVKISAGGSNDVELLVPFQHFNTYLTTNEMVNYGRLSIRVLNKMSVTDNVSSVANLTIWVSLENVECHGLIAVPDCPPCPTPIPPKPQMESISELCNVGSDVLRIASKAFNRDKPPLPLQPLSWIPETMTSFAYTDGVPEPLHVLRADPRGQRIPAVISNEMDVLSVITKWGYLSTMNWQFSHGVQRRLKKIPVAPLSGSDIYDAKKEVQPVTQIVYPPIAVVSSMFGKYRGDIQYKFEVVANQYYTGALQISVVPLASGDETFEQSQFSATYNFDIKQSSEMVVTIPWVWRNAWAEMKLQGAKSDIFAYIYVYVLNPLIAIAQVPSTIPINVYIRGTPSFELAQLRSPAISLASNVIVPPKDEYAYMYNVETKIYSTWNRNCKIGDSNNFHVLYVQNITNGWEGFTNLQDLALYELSDKTLKGYEFRVPVITKKTDRDTITTTNYIKFGVYHKELSTPYAHGMVCFVTQYSAMAYLEIVKTKGYDPENFVNFKTTYGDAIYRQDAPWSQIKQGDKWVEAPNIDGDHPLWYRKKITVTPQMESLPLRAENPTILSAGIKTYGEPQLDLKSVGRRWQVYGSCRASTQNTEFPRDCGYLFKFPVEPSRIINPHSSVSYDNRVREGSISLINSGFYTWDGGMRYRIICYGDIVMGTIYVQHRYDDLSADAGITMGGPPMKAQDFMDTHYATHAQSLEVNPSVTFEVPYYRSSERCIAAGSYNRGQYPCHNGFVYVFVHTPKAIDLKFSIYYSLADDSQWHVFQGFPYMFDISSIPDEPKPQMNPPEQSTPQGWNSFFGFGRTQKKLEDNSDTVAKAAVETQSRLSKFMDSLESGFAKIKSPLESGYNTIMDNLTGTVYDVLSHLVYIVMNPKGPTIAFALVNMYKSIWGFSFKGAEKLLDAISSFWNKVWYSSQQPQNTQATGQMEREETYVPEICGVAFTSFQSMLNVKLNKPSSWRDVYKGLFDFSNCCRASQYVSKFVKDNLTLIKRIWMKIVSYFKSGDKQSIQLIQGVEDDRLRKWLMETIGILNPAKRDMVYTHPAWAEKVFELGVVGRGILLTVSSVEKGYGPLVKLITDNLTELKKLEQDMVQRRIFSGIRYEPFCLWLSGSAGSGKTMLANTMAEEFAQLSKSVSSSAYHTLTTNQQYFDGFINQPTIILDDFLAISPMTDYVVPLFLQMKSSILFNPAFSRAEEKSKVVNFQNLIVTSNFTGISNQPGIHDPDAYNRRRDLLLSFEFKSGWESKEQRLRQAMTNPDWFKNMDHLLCYYHPDPVKMHDKQLIARKDGESYMITVKNIIREKYKAYHTQEELQYKRRMDERINRLSMIESTSQSLNDYLDSVTKMMKEDTKDSVEPNELNFEYWMEQVKPKKEKKTIETQTEKLERLSKEEEEEAKRKEEKQNDSSYEDSHSSHGEDEHEEEPHGQGTEYLTTSAKYNLWPNVPDNICNRKQLESIGYLFSNRASYLYEVNSIVEPINIPHVFKENAPQSKLCLHMRAINDMSEYVWDRDLGVFVINKPNPNLPYAIPVGLCQYINAKNEMTHFPTCGLMESSYKNKFYRTASVHCFGFIPTKKDKNSTIPAEVVEALELNFSRDKIDSSDRRARLLSQYQEEISSRHTIIGDLIVPEESRWKRYPKKVWEWMKRMFKLVLHICMWLIILVTVILSLMMLSSLWTSYREGSFRNPYNKDFGVEQPQIHPSGDFKTVKQNKSMRERALQFVRGEISETQKEDIFKKFIDSSNVDPSMDGRMNKIISNSFWLIGIQDGKVYKGRCLGLYGYKFLIPKHYVDQFRGNNVQKVTLAYRLGQGMREYDLKDISFEWTEAGYGVGTFSTMPKMFKDITHLIPSEKFDGSYPYKMVMVEPQAKDVHKFELECTKLEQPKFIPEYQKQSGWNILQGFSYPWGGDGRCGSFLFCPQLACPLVGIHTAGCGSRIGYSEMLLRETFVKPESLKVDMVTPQMIFDENIMFEGDSYIHGLLPKEDGVGQARKTKICQSDIHGVFPVKTEPAPLTPMDPRLNEPVDPLLVGVLKRCDVPKSFDKKEIEICYLDYVQMLISAKPERQPGILKISEAIDGLSLEGYDPMTITTSEGYPWVLERPINASDKRWMFEFDESDGKRSVKRMYSKLFDVIKLKEEQRDQMLVPASYYTMCLKDARIKKEKVPIPGKTRVFEMSSVDLTIAQRQCFLDCYVTIMKNRMKLENTIGINCDGPEWTELATSLKDFSPYIITADYSSYGPRMLHEILDATISAHISWYDFWLEKFGYDQQEIDRQFKQRYCLKFEMKHAYHVMGRLVMQYIVGMDSGNTGTVIINSGANSIYIRLIYLFLAKKFAPHYADMFWFKKFIKLFTNGDDLIAAVKPDIIKWFNNRTMIEAFSEFNIKMTDALKTDGLVREFCDLEDATYLKRGFLRHPTRNGQWLAPLELDSITDTANWIWRSIDNRGASLVNSEMCCRLAYTHGPETYEKIVLALTEEWLSHGISFRAPSWISLDLHIWEGIEGPLFSFTNM